MYVEYPHLANSAQLAELVPFIVVIVPYLKPLIHFVIG